MTTLALNMVVAHEARRLRHTLPLLRTLVDELVIVDSGSVDGTELVSQPYADTYVWVRSSPRFCEGQRNIARKVTTSDWILILDADELPTEWLRNNLRKLIDDPEASAYYLRRENLLDGQPHPVAHYENHMRLCRREDLFHEENVHTDPSCLSKERIKQVDELCIYHHKTWEEQHYDDERYRTSTQLPVDYKWWQLTKNLAVR
jgi:glycosyltransferase involved in cell wall biosynthesis